MSGAFTTSALALTVMCLGGLAGPQGWQRVRAAGMEARLRTVGDELEVELRAPTRGWVVVGFNDHDGLQGARLFFARVVGDQVHAEAHVTDLSSPPPHHRRAPGEIAVVHGSERDQGTTVRIRIPKRLHRAGPQPWLVLAYSDSDDFSHHSRRREHVRIRLQ